MYNEYEKGWIEVITGPMFAGKSEELIRRVRTLSYAKKVIVAFKPKIDNRYDNSKISSHNGNMYKAFAVESVKEIENKIPSNADVIAIDEVQFFDASLVPLLEKLADSGKRVIVAGLSQDFRGEPFGIMPELLTRAEFLTKLEAICTVCGLAATRTQRLIDGEPASYDDPIIQVGADECYEARCRIHHIVKNKGE